MLFDRHKMGLLLLHENFYRGVLTVADEVKHAFMQSCIGCLRIMNSRLGRNRAAGEKA
ncbi:hypothetical protein [Brevibacillus reuszeri]|uniref:hypothetical protein n=1 Tax=Brevibacillus reuszeri TaxID=54915 RepID=UPI0013DF42C1|nr:hypothetical protein [Brevibacillus reuszeri]